MQISGHNHRHIPRSLLLIVIQFGEIGETVRSAIRFSDDLSLGSIDLSLGSIGTNCIVVNQTNESVVIAAVSSASSYCRQDASEFNGSAMPALLREDAQQITYAPNFPIK
jgi:hypothetical protein